MRSTPQAPEGTRGEPVVVKQHYEDIGGGFQVNFAPKCDLLRATFEGKQVASLKFSLTLPWIVRSQRLP